ncbi:hypothetical protein SAMN02799622_05739 [Methylobacterium sp. UNC378MF]|uniref:hypothetical protein n=1 Tax=Methylobacterium sp. UNC378MF TaxID=1502748 RepID=UPI0008887438|nr:hypothetical protein [Methylobacterium sp. UNC378MF]SDA34243.1 hypothetical protein SAMN02799622_05739 [Methylobacterium sp. UNC378MF]
MTLVRSILVLFALVTSASSQAADDPIEPAAKVVACYRGGSDTINGMYACSGWWVTPRILTLCFLKLDKDRDLAHDVPADCPVIPDTLNARQVVAAALGGEEKFDEKLAVDLSNILETPNRVLIQNCQSINAQDGFEKCVAQKMTPPALAPILNCALVASEAEQATCLAKTAPPQMSGASQAIQCIASKGGNLAAVQDCAKVQPWDKVQAVGACVEQVTAAGGKVDCLTTGMDDRYQELGRCLSVAGGRSTDTLRCLGKLDPDADNKMQELQCATTAGKDAAQVAACFAKSVKGDEAKIAACAVGDRDKIASCLLEIRPEYKAAAQVVACAQGGRDAGSLVANCSDFLIKDAKTRATLACAAKAGSDTKGLAGCAASAVFPPEIARYASCAVASQGPTSFALCAAGPLMNEEWRIAAECAVQTGGNPVGFAGCTAGRLTLKELTQCLSGGSCFGPNNTIVKFYTTAFNDLLHGPGANNDIVVALGNLGKLSGGPHSVVNEPGQIFGGANSVFHNPGQVLGGENSVANQFLTKPFGGDQSVPNVLVKGTERFVQNVGHTAEKAGQDIGHTAEKAGQDIGHTAEKAGQDIGHTAEKAGQDVGHAVEKGLQGIGNGLKKLNPF